MNVFATYPHKLTTAAGHLAGCAIALATAALLPATAAAQAFSPSFSFDGLEFSTVPGKFKFQARVSQARMPVGDAKFTALSVKLTGSRGTCEQSFTDVEVKDSVLNLDLNALNCTGPTDVADLFAYSGGVTFEVCFGGGQQNCLSVAAGSVPYAIKANVAAQASEARLADVAAQAHYAHRLSADPDMLVSDELGGTGYFSFATPDASYVPGATDIYTDFVPHYTDGFVVWAPVSTIQPRSMNVCAQDENGKLVTLDALHVFAADASFSGNVTVDANALIAGTLDVGGNTTIANALTVDAGSSDVSVTMGNLSVRSGHLDVAAGNVTVGDNISLAGASGTTVATRAEAGTMYAYDNLYVGDSPGASPGELQVHVASTFTQNASFDASVTVGSSGGIGDLVAVNDVLIGSGAMGSETGVSELVVDASATFDRGAAFTDPVAEVRFSGPACFANATQPVSFAGPATFSNASEPITFAGPARFTSEGANITFDGRATFNNDELAVRFKGPVSFDNPGKDVAFAGNVTFNGGVNLAQGASLLIPNGAVTAAKLSPQLKDLMRIILYSSGWAFTNARGYDVAVGPGPTGGTMAVAVNGTEFFTSGPGEAAEKYRKWTRETVASGDFRIVASDGGSWMVLGYEAGGTWNAWTSTNGISWSASTGFPSIVNGHPVQYRALAGCGGTWAAVGTNGGIGLIATYNGAQWSTYPYSAAGTSTEFASVACTASEWNVVGNDYSSAPLPVILTSSDCDDWTSVEVPEGMLHLLVVRSDGDDDWVIGAGQGIARKSGGGAWKSESLMGATLLTYSVSRWFGFYGDRKVFRTDLGTWQLGLQGSRCMAISAAPADPGHDYPGGVLAVGDGAQQTSSRLLVLDHVPEL